MAGASSPATVPPDPTFSKGDVVRVENLKSRQDLNGQQATILGFHEASSRYMVAVGPTEAIRLRSSNLQLVPHLLNLPPEVIEQVGLWLLRRDPPSVLRLLRTCQHARFLCKALREWVHLRRLRWLDEAEPADAPPFMRVFGPPVGNGEPQAVQRWLGPAELHAPRRAPNQGHEGLASDVTLSKDGRTVRQQKGNGAGWVAGPPLPGRGIIAWTVRLITDDWTTVSVGVSCERIGMSWALYLAGGSLRCLSRGPEGFGYWRTFSPPPAGYPFGNGNAIHFNKGGKPGPPACGAGTRNTFVAVANAPNGKELRHCRAAGAERLQADVEIIWDANGSQLYMRVNGGELIGPRYADDSSGPSHQPFVVGGFPRGVRLRPWVGLQGARDEATISPCWYEAGPSLRAALREFLAAAGAREQREQRHAVPESTGPQDSDSGLRAARPPPGAHGASGAGGAGASVDAAYLY